MEKIIKSSDTRREERIPPGQIISEIPKHLKKYVS